MNTAICFIERHFFKVVVAFGIVGLAVVIAQIVLILSAASFLLSHT